jgi:hypothetical protein
MTLSNAAEPLASGLKDNWKQRAKSNGGLVQNEATPGGLNDEHASAVKPDFKKRNARAGLVEEVIIHYQHNMYFSDQSSIGCRRHL